MDKMKHVLTFLLILLFLSTATTNGQAVTYPFEDLEGEEFNFRVSRSVDYTNYIEPSILITVVGNQEQSFAIRDSGKNTSEGTWLSGIEQLAVENKVQIGPLYRSGFNASSLEDKSGSVVPFNRTLPSAENMNDSLMMDVVPFVHDNLVNVKIGNETYISPFFTIEPVFFVTDIDVFIQSSAAHIRDYVSNMTSNLQLTTDVFEDDQSLEYSVEGEFPDIHQFTYYDNENFTSIQNHHMLDIEGSINIEFGEDKVLNDYSLSYTVSYEDIEIMQFDYSVSVRTGSGGNINIGDAGFNPTLEIFVLFFGVIIILMIYLVWKQRQLTIAYS